MLYSVITEGCVCTHYTYVVSAYVTSYNLFNHKYQYNKMKKLTIIATILCSIIFTACNDDDDEKFVTITFESANLNAEGFINDETYIEKGYQFINHYDATYSSWSGFAISNNTDMITEGYLNQFSVYNAKGGANNSKNFAIAFFSSYSGNPVISREDDTTFAPKGVSTCLTTYTYLSTQNGDAYSKKFEDGDYYCITFTGYDESQKNTNKVEYYAIDYRNGSKKENTDWSYVDLTPLGDKVYYIEITASSSDEGQWGMNTPGYIALDNFVTSE